MTRRKAKADAFDPNELSKADIRLASLTAWGKLEKAIQLELDALQSGERPLTATAATAILKFIEASQQIAASSDPLTQKDERERMARVLSNLPTFDDEPEE